MSWWCKYRNQAVRSHCILLFHNWNQEYSMNITRSNTTKGNDWWIQRYQTLMLRDHSGNGLSQWEMPLHCNGISHWLIPYPEWSLVLCYRHNLTWQETDRARNTHNWTQTSTSNEVRYFFSPQNIMSQVITQKTKYVKMTYNKYIINDNIYGMNSGL